MTEILTENAQQEIEITADTVKLIEACVNAVCEYEECDFDAEVSVTLVDCDEIRALNKEHRGKDAVTDVLSFPILEFDDEGNIIDSDFDFDDELVVLGDIVICAKRAAEQAEEYGHSFEREIAFLTVHSMLHLLGYDHEGSENQEQEMFRRQREILDKMGITRA
jgi:probable rRNA maturation factor